MNNRIMKIEEEINQVNEMLRIGEIDFEEAEIIQGRLYEEKERIKRENAAQEKFEQEDFSQKSNNFGEEKFRQEDFSQKNQESTEQNTEAKHEEVTNSYPNFKSIRFILCVLLIIIGCIIIFSKREAIPSGAYFLSDDGISGTYIIFNGDNYTSGDGYIAKNGNLYKSYGDIPDGGTFEIDNGFITFISDYFARESYPYEKRSKGIYIGELYFKKY